MACKYIFNGVEYKDKETFVKEFVNPNFINQPKTLRVQEYQSDYFQKLRNDFTFNGERHFITTDSEGKKHYYINKEGKKATPDRYEVSSNEYNKAFDAFIDSGGDNQFLALLHKNDNWITFGIKAIIQNAAKKGYEKVLFPKGDTAAKIEGHQTLEEFKKQKEARIKELEEKKKTAINNKPWLVRGITGNKKHYFNTEEEANEFRRTNGRENFYSAVPTSSLKDSLKNVEDLNNEINQLKQELERVETEGFSALKPIYNFYENTINNILKKNGYNPVEITDEYGNKWNEVELDTKALNNILLSIQDNKSKVIEKAKEFNNVLKNIAKNIGVDVKFVDSLVSRHGMTLNGLFKVTDDLKGLIQISKDATDDLTLSEELSHAIIDGFEELPVVKNILRLVKSEGYESFLGDNLQDYKQLYAGNESKLIKEAAGKALSKALYNQFKEDSESKLIKAFKALWNRIKSIFGKVSEQTVTDLDNSLKELSIAVLGEELGTTQYTKKASFASVKSKTRDKYHKQVVYLKLNIGRLTAKLAELDEDSQEYTDIKSIITSAQKDIVEYEKSGNIVYLKEAVSVMLSEIEQFVDEYEKSGGKVKPTETELVHIETLLRAIPELNDNVISLIERFVEMQTDYINAITSRAIQKKFDFDEYQTIADKDIGVLTKSFNTLINIEDKLTYAIGFITKEAQIKISSKQSDLFNSIKDKIALVDEWAAENGIKKGDMYNIFIQKYGGTTVLTRPYTEEFYDRVNEFFKNKNYDGLKKFAKKTEDGWVPYDTKKYTNPNYTKIMSDKRLKEFYNFYQKTITEALDKLPINRNNPLSRHFIPNIMMNNFSDVMKAETMGGRFKNLIKYTTGLRYKEVKESDFIKDESLERDIIPLKYLSKLTADSKSNDIGESLFKFAAFAIEHEHLSDILPKTRILQSGITRSNYISSTNDRLVKDGKDTNLHDMVDKFIQMQILGKKKEDSAKIFRKDITDESGNKIGEKGIDVGDLADFGLTWNSLLRIGLNPFTAITNVLVGDAGNIIEAFGSRFFTIGQLNKATGIFFKDITNSDSKVNHIIEKYPLMQELTDYEYAGRLRVAKGLTGEELKNYMYGMQKSGEVFLQARTMIAMMLNTKPDGKTNLWEMLDDKGELKPEYKSVFPNKEAFDNYMVRLSAKIIGVNERIHGRYSSRDAAIINQNVLWRMAFQFKKWIPAAVETRFESYRYDERLGVEIEGRWRTMFKLLSNLRDTAARMDRGELKEYEIYNLRKTLTEFVLVLGTWGLYMALGWDDDEKRKKSAMYKFTMDQLDRVSGDLLFWANPRNVTALSKSPIAATKLVDDVWTVATNIPYALYLGDYEYKSGPRKGENKFYSRLGSIVPGVKPTQDFMRLFNEQKYRDYTQ